MNTQGHSTRRSCFFIALDEKRFDVVLGTPEIGDPAAHKILGAVSARAWRRNHGKLVCMRICFAILFVFDLCGRAQSLPSIPDNLKPPANETLILQAHALGDQIYVCNASSWTFSRPDAKLFDDSGKPIGSHSAGPTWEYSDGSRVIGKAAATATPDPNSIPWLLLKATDHQGDGVMKKVTSIVRLSTKGGMAPASSCDAQHKGQEARSHYTAIYLFYSGL